MTSYLAQTRQTTAAITTAAAALEHAIDSTHALLDTTGNQDRREQLLQALAYLCGALDMAKRAAPHARSVG